jgi:hypothetical protein
MAVQDGTLARDRWARGCRQTCMDAWDDEARVIPFQGEAREVGRAAKCMAHMGRAHEQQPFATARRASPRLGEGIEMREGLPRGSSSQGKPSRVSVEGPRAAQPSQAGGPHEQATSPSGGAHEQTSHPRRAHEQDHGRAHEHPNLGAHEQPAKPCGEGPRGPTSRKFLASRGRWPCGARHWREVVGVGVAGKPAWMPGVMKPGSSHSRVRHRKSAERPNVWHIWGGPTSSNPLRQQGRLPRGWERVPRQEEAFSEVLPHRGSLPKSLWRAHEQPSHLKQAGPTSKPPGLVRGPTSRPPPLGGPTSRTTGGPTSTQIWGPTSSPLSPAGRAHEGPRAKNFWSREVAGRAGQDIGARPLG